MASCQELQIYQKETKYETIERERDMWRNILSYRHKEIAKKQTTETEKYKNYNFKPVFYSFLRWVGCEERHPRQRTPELQTFKLRHFKKKHKPILIRIFQRVICSLSVLRCKSIPSLGWHPCFQERLLQSKNWFN